MLLLALLAALIGTDLGGNARSVQLSMSSGTSLLCSAGNGVSFLPYTLTRSTTTQAN